MEQKLCRKIIILLSLALGFSFALLYLKLMPASYAWFHAAVSSKGEIVNSTTADLLAFQSGNLIFEEDGTVSPKISIKNISTISIPIKVELILNNQVIDTSSQLVLKNEVYTPPFKRINLDIRNEHTLQVRIIGFEHYIDELFSLPMVQ